MEILCSCAFGSVWQFGVTACEVKWRRRCVLDFGLAFPSYYSVMSSALYHLKQNFTLGAYKNLLDISLPDVNSPEYSEFLVYKARAQIALGNPRAVASLVPKDSENVALKSVLALAKFTAAPESAREELLEQFRDLAVELEGEDAVGSQQDKDTAKVLAGAAFAASGEVEEALETLGAGTQNENLEA
jgi:coatomer protein complex subunit epsilon